MNPILLTTAVLMKKQKPRWSRLLGYIAVLVCAAAVYTLLVISGIPPVGLVVPAAVFVTVTFGIIGWMIKADVTRKRECIAGLQNGICVSTVVLVKKESVYDDLLDTGATWFLIYRDAATTDEELPLLYQRVSSRQYDRAVIGATYYAIHVTEEDAVGKRYRLEDLYSTSEYILSEELALRMTDYADIAAANEVYVAPYWKA